jgi:hypothetical protein
MKKLLFACVLIVTMVSCTDPMEETMNNGGIDGDPITIKQIKP